MRTLVTILVIAGDDVLLVLFAVSIAIWTVDPSDLVPFAFP